METTPTPKTRPRSRTWLAGGIAAVVLLLIAGVVLWRYQTGKTADESQAVIKQVASLYLVPENETPTVAEIRDVTKLDRSQQFYAKAQTGDYVVYYAQAKLALLYRSGAHKLVYASPVVPGSAAVQP